MHTLYFTFKQAKQDVQDSLENLVRKVYKEKMGYLVKKEVQEHLVQLVYLASLDHVDSLVYQVILVYQELRECL